MLEILLARFFEPLKVVASLKIQLEALVESFREKIKNPIQFFFPFPFLWENTEHKNV